MQGKFVISTQLLQVQYRREKCLIRQSSRSVQGHVVQGKCREGTRLVRG